MAEGERAVLRFLDGTILKGYLDGFTGEASEITVHAVGTENTIIVSADSLKAIFFVKTFEGDRQYNEVKAYGIRKPRGHRTFIKFNDGEDMVGFIEGKVPWEKGFFLSDHKMMKLKGFYLLPADESSNNNRVFVFTRAIRDVTVVP
jgi:hypothetical protein